MSGCQHKASIKKNTNYDDQIKRFKTKRYQLDFKVCISKLGVNDQQIKKLLHTYILYLYFIPILYTYT